MKTRVSDREEGFEYQYPAILPSKHPVVEKMIRQYHLQNKHAGVQALIVILRDRVWIRKGRRAVGKVVHNCVRCKRHIAKALEMPSPPLPTDRTQISSCFQVCGIDLAGPLITRDNQKCWVVIFTCAVYRAVHLKVIQSLNTEAFIRALRRLIARRGRISVIYSDNGTNFVSLNKNLKSLNWTEIQNTFSLNAIVWKFIPPASPWWGGFWERLIGILKGLLRRNLGNSSLTYEEINTLVCECEGIMNRRPLTYVSEETGDLRPLTPSMYLQSIVGNEVTDLDILERTSLKTRWRYIQSLRDNMNSRFKKEYLGFLKSSNKLKSDDINVGDVVLVQIEDRRRITWPLGIVIKLFPGKDGKVRLVQVKTKKGLILRPIQRLYPLEVTGEGLNEDFLFCDLAKKKGGVCYKM
ncbi:uncharacterized protein LOC128984608 [Macrosteles quadrilineatus]|uniref:uncharacterized protein LOC128984608 n=1 Tax=Macrosteles quadrilineatus TaxID=74068 RepID=UPI0023E33AAA|nr:uncharacterized protein LOC128984608 [Macrosteles quadrilineatus]